MSNTYIEYFDDDNSIDSTSQSSQSNPTPQLL